MSAPIMKPERRQARRIRPEGIAYINFEPENGGIVVDVSEQGLCFQSVAPLPASRDDVVRFWFSAEGNRIEAEGRLAWIDDKRKTGGVQFQTVTPKGRLQIQNWIKQASEPFPSPKRTLGGAAAAAAASAQLASTTGTPETKPAPSSGTAVSTQRALEPASTAKFRKKKTLAVVSAARWAAWRRSGALRWTEYSRGLATGLLVSAVVLVGLLLRANRRHIGELLIRLGEGFGAERRPGPASVQEPGVAVAVRQTRSTQATLSPPPSAPTRPRVRAPELKAGMSGPVLSRSTPKAGRETERKPERGATGASPSVKPVPALGGSLALPLPAGSSAVAERAANTLLSAGSVPTAAAAGNAATRAAPAGATVLETKPGGRPAGSLDASAELSTSIPLGKYFQVGKFSDELQADRLIERLDQSGYRAVVVPKNLLWMSSFEVLAGPYGSEKDAQVARRGLRSEGFKAQSLPRQSREFWLPVVRKLYSDVDIPEGFVVSWESYGADATVRFVRGAETIATVRGEWVKEKQRHDQDGVMYDGKGEGSRTLLEIWFRGMDQSVVFHPAPGSQAMTF